MKILTFSPDPLAINEDTPLYVIPDPPSPFPALGFLAVFGAGFYFWYCVISFFWETAFLMGEAFGRGG
jgi:hypothetical protein